MNEPSELTTEVERIVNRHTARLLTELEEANCPRVFREAVKSEIQWLRSDLKEATESRKE